MGIDLEWQRVIRVCRRVPRPFNQPRHRARSKARSARQRGAGGVAPRNVEVRWASRERHPSAARVDCLSVTSNCAMDSRSSCTINPSPPAKHGPVRHPENHYPVRPDEEIVPGVAVWKPGCAAVPGRLRLTCASGRGRRRGPQRPGGRLRIAAAKKMEGAPDHPEPRRRGARGQSAIQITYHPGRITRAHKRPGSRPGRYDAIS